MVRIELVDKIIKIPANKETLVMHDNNAEEFFIRIPRSLLTSEIENSQVFLLAQLNNYEPTMEVLEPFYGEDDWIDYIWKVERRYTGQEGELKIQIKIIREEADDENEEPSGEEPKITNCNIICKYSELRKNNINTLTIKDLETEEYVFDGFSVEGEEEVIVPIIKAGDYEIVSFGPTTKKFLKTITIEEGQTTDIEVKISLPGNEEFGDTNPDLWNEEEILQPQEPLENDNIEVQTVGANITLSNSEDEKEEENKTEIDEGEKNEEGEEGSQEGDEENKNEGGENEGDNLEDENPPEENPELEPPPGETWVDDIDPGMMPPLGNDSPGVWYSYQNKFNIVKALDVLL